MYNNIILLEGIDGCGKSSVANHILQMADADDIAAVTFRDPGCTPLGERIRKITSDPLVPMTPMAQTLAFMSARLQLVDYVNEEIERYDLIILDRYWPSTIAYQCFGGDVPRDFVLSTVEATDALYPDIVIPIERRFCLRIDPNVAHERRMADKKRSGERFKAADMAFKYRVADGYEWLIEQGLLTPIDVGTSSAEEVAKMIYKRWSDAQ